MVMGILNLTPDSFSDGGQYLHPEVAVRRALEMVEQGAEILDIGGESTRPGALPISESEELRRVIPVLQRLSKEISIPISIDTMKPKVARAALEVGVSIVNDVGANRRDSEMWDLVAKTGAGYVCMHMRGTPETMQLNPVYKDVVQEVKVFFFERMEAVRSCGVLREQIILDPGIGFGKKIEHNLALLNGLKEFAALDRPLLLGVSRKSFLGKVSGGKLEGRLAAGLACASLAVAAGARIIRTHDVAETLQTIRMTEAIVSKREE